MLDIHRPDLADRDKMIAGLVDRVEVAFDPGDDPLQDRPIFCIITG